MHVQLYALVTSSTAMSVFACLMNMIGIPSTHRSSLHVLNHRSLYDRSWRPNTADQQDSYDSSRAKTYDTEHVDTG